MLLHASPGGESIPLSAHASVPPAQSLRCAATSADTSRHCGCGGILLPTARGYLRRFLLERFIRIYTIKGVLFYFLVPYALLAYE